jgi:2-succinyl-5-enolpyruvyl-6-hydroxy-3-cyclohexene-1-carboxylate synthase
LKAMDAYTEAHLFVAAIRLLQHKSGSQPTMEDISTMLEISTEQVLATGRKLAEKGIVEQLKDPFSVRFAIIDHTKIENLPQKVTEETGLSQELEKFMAQKKQDEKKIETIQAELDKKKQSLFESIEQKFKKELKNKG